MALEKAYRVALDIPQSNHYDDLSYEGYSDFQEMPSLQDLPDYHEKYLTYRGLELRDAGVHNPKALSDLEGMEGDLEAWDSGFGSEEVQGEEEIPNSNPASGDLVGSAKEIGEFSKKVAAVKSQISNAGLDNDALKNLTDKADGILRDLKTHSMGWDEAKSQLEELHDNDFATAKDNKERNDEGLKELKREIEQEKRAFKNTVHDNEKLNFEDKKPLMDTFSKNSDELLSEKDPEKANKAFEDLKTRMQDQMDATVDANQEKNRQETESFRQDLMKVADKEYFGGNGGHHWDTALQGAQTLKSALQIDKWDNFRSFISQLTDGDKRFAPIMRLVTALFRAGGKNEENTLQMINHLIPQDIVQAMIDKVTEASSSLDFGGGIGHENQIGTGEFQCQWTPRGTADFLRRSLDARKDFDPYQSNRNSSSPSK